MAREIGFDASYISRICSGSRKPSNTEDFVNSICKYIVKTYSDDNDKILVAEIINAKLEDINNENNYFQNIQNWLFLERHTQDNSTINFLKKLDEFNLDEYRKAIHFDKLKVPTLPFHIPSSKNYYGLEAMKNAELDFFKTTVTSKTKEPIFMYNDMPMEDMAKDLDFGKKWMFAIACSLKKGLHLNMIHNLNRPFKELMLGLESWIPIYMTGQISPYYFKTSTNNVFSHSLYVSEVCSLFGEGLNNYHNNSKYYLTSKKNELEFYKSMSDGLLKEASPLMKIFTVENNKEFKLFIENEKANKSNHIIKITNNELLKTFKNIIFTSCKDKWVMISKKTNPEIHFVIYHPKLRDAIENFIVPVIENN